jgi:hypothetical protein
MCHAVRGVERRVSAGHVAPRRGPVSRRWERRGGSARASCNRPLKCRWRTGPSRERGRRTPRGTCRRDAGHRRRGARSARGSAPPGRAPGGFRRGGRRRVRIATPPARQRLHGARDVVREEVRVELLHVQRRPPPRPLPGRAARRRAPCPARPPAAPAARPAPPRPPRRRSPSAPGRTTASRSSRPRSAGSRCRSRSRGSRGPAPTRSRGPLPPPSRPTPPRHGPRSAPRGQQGHQERRQRGPLVGSGWYASTAAQTPGNAPSISAVRGVAPAGSSGPERWNARPARRRGRWERGHVADARSRGLGRVICGAPPAAAKREGRCLPGVCRRRGTEVTDGTRVTAGADGRRAPDHRLVAGRPPGTSD